MECQERLQTLENDLAEKRKGGSQVTKEEFTRYADRLRVIAKDYKAKKADLSNVRSEAVVLDSTVAVLEAKAKAMDDALKKLEEERGYVSSCVLMWRSCGWVFHCVPCIALCCQRLSSSPAYDCWSRVQPILYSVAGFRETQQTLEAVSMAHNTMNARKEENLQNITKTTAELNKEIERKRTDLAPEIRKLKAARMEKQSLQGTYDEKKAAYEKLAKDLEASRSTLEREVRGYREEVAAYESRYHHLNALLTAVQAQNDRIQEEKKAYRTQKPSFRDACQEKIDEAERLGKHLREKQIQIEQNHDNNLRQCQLWHDLRDLMRCKLTAAPENKEKLKDGPTVEENRLVL